MKMEDRIHLTARNNTLNHKVINLKSFFNQLNDLLNSRNKTTTPIIIVVTQSPHGKIGITTNKIESCYFVINYVIPVLTITTHQFCFIIIYLISSWLTAYYSMEISHAKLHAILNKAYRSIF